MRRPAAALAIALLACSTGEGASVRERVEASASPIIAGVDSDASQDAVVLVMHYDAVKAGGGTEGCTGVLLTPELVLTARHCVAVTDGSAACDSDGTPLAGGGVEADFAPEALYVFSGNKRPDFISGTAQGARGVELVTTGAKTICNNDLALILLDRPVPGAKIAPVRLDAPPAEGELVTVVGWGITTETSFPDTRQTRDGVEIVAVGPARQLGDAEFKTGEGTCSGDSGGPAIADTGAVLGVLSRGGNGSGGAGAANCVDGENVWSSVAAHRDVILAAYEKAGQEPWLEGNPNPRLGKLAAECAADDACQSGVCNGTMCSELCDVDPCPGGWACAEGEGGRKVCVKQEKNEEGGGCHASGAGGRGGAGSWLLVGLAVGRLARRRRS